MPVSVSLLWASENIATNTPDPLEAPEIFRVLGKRRPDYVKPYIDGRRKLADADPNHVVRIHCQGAILAAGGD